MILNLDERVIKLKKSIASALVVEDVKEGADLFTQSMNAFAKNAVWYSAASATAVLTETHAIFGDLEIAFRTYLQEVVAEEKERGSKVLGAPVKKLLLFAMNFAVLMDTSPEGMPPDRTSKPAGKIPFLLLDDYFEGQTTASCKIIWKWMEESKDLLTVAGVFARGKLYLLRLCNWLLKQLSRMHDTEFSGRVLMFLSAVFPLTDPSGVNMGGRKNLANITSFEDEEEFVKAAMGAGEQTARVIQPADSGEGSVEGDEFPIDYALYRAFWNLQQHFLEPEKALKTLDAWNKLLAQVDKVLAAFEGNAFQEYDVSVGRERSASTTVGPKGVMVTPNGKNKAKIDSNGDSSKGKSSSHVDNMEVDDGVEEEEQGAALGKDFFVCKYLTNSRLLRLQLRDPILRLQVLTQMLIMIKTCSAPNLTKVKGVFPETALAAMKKRVKALIGSTPPHGKDYYKLITSTLEYEDNWLRWKANQCKTYEKMPEPQTSIVESGDKDMSKSSARNGSLAVKRQRLGEKERPFSVFNVNSLPQVASELQGRTPKTDDYLGYLIECMDPEAGVEEEYHPKNNKSYCWRAMRLMSSERADLLDVMCTGDVEKGVRKMKGIPEPEAEKPKEKAKAEAEEKVSSKKEEKSEKSEQKSDKSRKSEKETADKDSHDADNKDKNDSKDEKSSSNKSEKEKSSKDRSERSSGKKRSREGSSERGSSEAKKRER